LKLFFIWFIFLQILFHQTISNTVIGNNNSFIGVFFFLFIFATIFASLYILKVKKTVWVYIFSSILLLLIFLWKLNPVLFKIPSFIFINFYLAFFINITKSSDIVLRQLNWVLKISLILFFFQISGIFEFFHLWNSQFLDSLNNNFFKNISLNNILLNDWYDANEYDSKQVRAPGIFHSSAVVSAVIVIYLANLFNGNFKSNFSYLLAPLLIVFSGSKLTMIVFSLMLIISFIYRKVNLKILTLFTFSFFISLLIHTTLFKFLFYEQFNLNIFIYSFDVRFTSYLLFDLIESINYNLVFGLILSLLVMYRIIKRFSSFLQFKNNRYKLILFLLAFLSAFFANPQIGNLFFGWFLFSTFFINNNSNVKN